MDTIVAMSAAARPVAAARTARLAWLEARPLVQAMFQLRFLAAATLAVTGGGGTGPDHHLLAGAAAWLCATWWVYLLNGVCDQVEDRTNGSGRPLASGRLQPAAARRVLAGLAVGALALAPLAGAAVVVLVAVMLGLGWCYSGGRRPCKAGVAGTVTVITAGGLATFLAGWYAAGGGTPGPAFLVVATAMSLWMALVGMTKDLPDVAGDRIAGRRSLPVLLGRRRARAVLAGLALALGLGTVFGAWYAGVQLLFAVALLAGAALVAVTLLAGRPGAERRPYQTFMLVQYVLHATVVVEALA